MKFDSYIRCYQLDDGDWKPGKWSNRAEWEEVNANRRNRWATPTGAVAGILVVDLDEMTDPAARFLEDTGVTSVDTYKVKSKSEEGWHWYFKYPGGCVIARTIGIVPGIDILADKSLVYCWPSPGYVEKADVPIADAPQALIDAITNAPMPKVPATQQTISSPPSPSPPPQIAVSALYEGEGARNNKLMLQGVALRKSHNNDECDIADILQARNLRQFRPPLDEAEVRSIAASVARYPGGMDEMDIPEGDWPICHMDEILNFTLPDKVCISGPLETAMQLFVAAHRGLGKTLLMVEWAHAIAAGKDFGSWKSDGIPRKVLYVQFDMPVHNVKRRHIDYMKAHGKTHPNFHFTTRWQFSSAGIALPRMGNKDHHELWLEHLEPYDVTFFDTMKKVQPAENGVSSWVPEYWSASQDLRFALVDQGKTLIWAHHANEDTNTVKDTKAIEDDVDELLLLTPTTKGSEDTCLQMSSTKDRDASAADLPMIWEFEKHTYRWRSWTDHQLAENVYNAYKEGAGKTMVQLAQQFNLDRRTISKKIREYEIKLRQMQAYKDRK